MTIRNAVQGDVRAIASVHVLAWQVAYRGILPDALLDNLDVSQRANLWRGWLSGRGVHTLVACGPPGVVGFSRLCPARAIATPPPSTAEVTHLYVHPDEQSSGVGRQLLAEAIGIARQEQYRGVLLWVLEANGRATRFYERFGFTVDGARRTDPAFLGNDSAEVRYALTL